MIRGGSLCRNFAQVELPGWGSGGFGWQSKWFAELLWAQGPGLAGLSTAPLQPERGVASKSIKAAGVWSFVSTTMDGGTSLTLQLDLVSGLPVLVVRVRTRSARGGTQLSCCGVLSALVVGICCRSSLRSCAVIGASTRPFTGVRVPRSRSALSLPHYDRS